MSAFLFSLAIFFFWGLVGFATVSVFSPRLRVIQGILLSPALGIAATVLPVFLINRMGIPVKEFGGFLLPALALISVGLLAIKRPVFPVKRLLPYLGVLVAALYLAGRPMFSYGFDWLSVANDDMANYCLAAQRFLNHGFFDQPNIDDLLTGKDYSLAYWFMHATGGVRSGSELMLALVWAVFGLNAHQIFMPVIMALHLVLIAGAGAMVAGNGSPRRASLVAMGLLAISPLASLGAIYQLIGQVGGLALLTAAVTLTYRPCRSSSFFKLLHCNVPAVLIFSSIFVWYPEVLPFFGLGWILYVLLELLYRRQSALLILKPALIVGVLVLIGLNTYAISAITFMLAQVSGGMKPAMDMFVFPYFLVPSGIPAFWGLIPIAREIHEPILSLSIAGGIALFYWLGRYILPNQIKDAKASACMLFVMLLMGLLLFYRNNDFGLFKLAMFAQPFLMGVVAIELSRIKTKNFLYYVKVLLLSVALISLIISQYSYVKLGTDEEIGGQKVISYASEHKFNRQFTSVLQTSGADKEQDVAVILETSNIVLAKLQALYTNNIHALFPARTFFYGIIEFARSPEDLEMAERSKQYNETKLGDNSFYTLLPSLVEGYHKIYIYPLINSDIFNLYFRGSTIKGYFDYSEKPINRLQFINSELGNHYYLGDRKNTAIYQLENDPMFPGQKFSSLGRRLLFQVKNPSNHPVMVMELSATVVKQFNSELPTPSVQNSPVNFVGRGSGRVFSAPITTSKIDGAEYISIDMGRDGKAFPSRTKGLMLLYGRSIPADQRRVTAFGRDISLVSEEEYKAILPPANIKSFPSDLANKNLEYSGIYEDGWISERSFFVLSPGATSKFLTVAGSISQIDDPKFFTVLKLSVNGREVASTNLGLGNFELKIPIISMKPKQRIELEFSNYQTLPGVDGRIAPAKINFIGFE